MIEGKDENDYNEVQARDLADYLLKNDIPIFNNFRNEIRAMDSHSFLSLFQGIPFKSPENPNGFEYKVKNKKSFEELIKKFDNFYGIINSWYPDQKYYPYIKQLWENYISIKHLASMNENSREEFLNSYDIDYKNWPEDIQKDFIKLLGPARYKEISPEEFGEMEELSQEFKYLLKKMYKFKSDIEDEPEMITYERNTNKFIKTLKSIFNKIILLSKELCGGKTGKVLGILGSLPFVDSFGVGVFDGNYNNSNLDIVTDSGGLNQSLENSIQESKLKNLLGSPNLGLCVYTALSFINLSWSVLEFNNAYKDLKNIKKKIKGEKGDNGYEKKLETIGNNFNKHKEKIGILPDDFKESLKIIGEVYKEICQDYNDLEKLINDINNDIAVAEEHKNESIFGLISSILLGIGGFIITKNVNSFWYGASLTSNVVSGISHTIILVDSKDTIEKLNEILNKAKKQKEEIKAKLDDLINMLSELEKGRLKKFEKKFKVDIKKNI